jgi:hypothetical protein
MTNVGLVYELYDLFIKFPLLIVIIFEIYIIIGNCSLPLQRVHEIKRMYLASRTHGLFIN